MVEKRKEKGKKCNGLFPRYRQDRYHDFDALEIVYIYLFIVGYKFNAERLSRYSSYY